MANLIPQVTSEDVCVENTIVEIKKHEIIKYPYSMGQRFYKFTKVKLHTNSGKQDFPS